MGPFGSEIGSNVNLTEPNAHSAFRFRDLLNLNRRSGSAFEDLRVCLNASERVRTPNAADVSADGHVCIGN
jgi:hypothetical protein